MVGCYLGLQMASFVELSPDDGLAGASTYQQGLWQRNLTREHQMEPSLFTKDPHAHTLIPQYAFTHLMLVPFNYCVFWTIRPVKSHWLSKKTLYTWVNSGCTAAAVSSFTVISVIAQLLTLKMKNLRAFWTRNQLKKSELWCILCVITEEFWELLWTR